MLLICFSWGQLFHAFLGCCEEICSEEWQSWFTKKCGLCKVDLSLLLLFCCVAHGKNPWQGEGPKKSKWFLLWIHGSGTMRGNPRCVQMLISLPMLHGLHQDAYSSISDLLAVPVPESNTYAGCLHFYGKKVGSLNFLPARWREACRKPFALQPN